MRVFLTSLIAAAVIAVVAAAVLAEFQQPVEASFATSAVRL